MRVATSCLLFGAVVALAGCPSLPRSPSGPDAAGLTTSPGPGDAAGALTAADAPPATLQLALHYLGPDAGMVPISFTDGGPPLIEPTTRLELAANLALQNYRVRLFDEVDRAMISDDEAEEQGDRTLYRIHLPSPLKTGHRYALVLDAQTGSAVADALGRTHPDQRLELAVAGERVPDAPVKKVKATKTRTRTKTKPPPRRRRR